MIAEGLTNGGIAQRLRISAKTVDHHVSAILGKLGIGSRKQAAQFFSPEIGAGRREVGSKT